MMRSSVGASRRLVAVAAAWACGVAMVVLTAPPSRAADVAPVVSAVPSTSWEVNGRVWATAVVGDTVLVGGNFTETVSAAGERVARRNLAAFRMSTGELIREWQADAGSTVRALEADGEWVYVGGAFGRVGGVVNAGLAKVRVGDAYVDPSFKASFNAPVRALDARAGSVWVGGAFTQVNGMDRYRLARVDAVTGAVDPSFKATPNGDVWALVAHPSRPVVYAAGNFSTVNGVVRSGVAALSHSGTVEPIIFGSSARPTLGLDLDETGTRLFGAGGSITNTMAAWNTTTGVRVWRHVVMGDVQTVKHYGGKVWFGFHDGYQQDTSTKVLVADATTGLIDQSWRPRFDMFWGVFSIAVSESGLVLGGEFSTVSGVRAPGWARFPALATPEPEPEPEPPASGLPVRLTSESEWRFWDAGTRPVGWETSSFDDQGWAAGLPEFGYGDGDEKTLLRSSVNGAPRHVTSYFRTEFEVVGAPRGADLALLVDDGAVVYVNGTEIARTNMPVGVVGNNTRAASNRSGQAETRFVAVPVPAGALQTGRNVIAVEVHQDQPGSSDLTFAATLEPVS